MILYKCDLCKQIVDDSQHTFLKIGDNLGHDTFDICTKCYYELKNKLETKDEKENEQNG